jgi:ABC-2 type transport system ATP-binding protein
MSGSAARTEIDSPAISTSDLSKRYGNIEALSGLTMTIPRGAVFGFLGPNGAGKTTAVKLLLGLARPTSGHAEVLAQPIGSRASRRRVGYLPELFRYQSWLTAREVLLLHCRLAGIDRAAWPREIEDALAVVGLTERGSTRVGTFSKGMQQRLGLGVALLGDPELVLLDEPTSALDPVGRHDVREIIRALKERGMTVFLNSHLLTEVEQVCDRVTIVDHGKVVADGTLAELLRTDTVRIRATDLPRDAHIALARFGEIAHEGEWLTVRGVDADRIPEIVSEIVRLGGRVYAVEPKHESLEDRFLSLLGGGA